MDQHADRSSLNAANAAVDDLPVSSGQFSAGNLASATKRLHTNKASMSTSSNGNSQQHKSYLETRHLQGKENQNQHYERFCFECNRSLAKSRHLINIAGQMYKWHPECFKCNVCDHPLDRETTCHLYKDKIVCRDDYAKLQRDNSIKCSRCRWPIGASDWVRKAGDYVYHLACFSCDICLRQLSTGEQFTINTQDKNIVRLLCRLHFAIDSQPPQVSVVSNHTTQDANNNSTTTNREPTDRSLPSTPSTTATTNTNTSFDFTNYGRAHCSTVANKFHHHHHHHHHNQSDQYLHLLASTSVGTPAAISGAQPAAATLLLNSSSGSKAATSTTLTDHHFEDVTLAHQLSTDDIVQQQHCSTSINSQRATHSTSSSNGSTSGIMGMGQSKSKRVRTTFTEEQLHILQNHFHLDSNPDGQDLERIATITGLSKRVTQVWFQNSRARQKKYMIKRKPPSSAPSSMVSTTNIGQHLPGSGGGGGSKLDPSSSQFNQIQHQQQQQIHHGEPSSAAAECYLHGSGGQQRWSTNMSDDRSDLSLDDGAVRIGDVEDNTRSSVEDDDDDLGIDNQLIISEDSSSE